MFAVSFPAWIVHRLQGLLHLGAWCSPILHFDCWFGNRVVFLQLNINSCCIVCCGVQLSIFFVLLVNVLPCTGALLCLHLRCIQFFLFFALGQFENVVITTIVVATAVVTVGILVTVAVAVSSRSLFHMLVWSWEGIVYSRVLCCCPQSCSSMCVLVIWWLEEANDST